MSIHDRNAIAVAKQNLRGRAVTQRYRLDGEMGAAAAEGLCETFIRQFSPGGGQAIGQVTGGAIAAPENTHVISGYCPMRSEINPWPLMTYLAAVGCELCLPVIVDPSQSLIFRQWREGLAMETGPYGIEHPACEVPEAVPDVILAPLLAFDREGYRLGFGGGYYDRTIELIRSSHDVICIGVAFAEQEIDSVPHEDHDQRLDWILTPSEAIRISRHGGAE